LLGSVAVEASLSASFFDGYQCDKLASFLLDVDTFCRVLQWLDDKELKISCLVLKAGAKGSLQLLFEGNEGQDIASYGSLFCVLAGPDTFSLCLCSLIIFSHCCLVTSCQSQVELFVEECDENRPATVDSLHSCTITMPPVKFRGLVEKLRRMQADVSGQSSRLLVSGTKSRVTFSVKGSFGSGTIPVVTDEASGVYIDLHEPFEGCWLMQEISAATSPPFHAQRVVITCTSDQRFVVHYPICFARCNGEVGSIRYVCCDDGGRRCESYREAYGAKVM
jgi:Proliferating cell nuclear antigen, C-terminal domain